jgi:predicted DCC family thiol-disulfide oxidoreductase YuxK
LNIVKAKNRNQMENRTILFYDGECGVCSRTVRFILKNERSNELYFSSLQGDFAICFLAEFGIKSVSSNTLYLFENGKLYNKSRAAMKLIAYLKRPFGLLKMLYIFPRFFRDFVYDRIAANRKVFFKDVCELISLDKNRFL